MSFRTGNKWHLPIGRDVAHQAHGLRLARAFKVYGIAPVNSAQRDHLLRQPAAQEIAHASKARVAGLLDPHAKRDAALIQRCHQPARRVAPVKQQQIAD